MNIHILFMPTLFKKASIRLESQSKYNNGEGKRKYHLEVLKVNRHLSNTFYPTSKVEESYQH